MTIDELWLLFLMTGALGYHQCRGRLALAKTGVSGSWVSTGLHNQFWRKIYIDANGNLPNEMRLPVRNRSHAPGATLPVAIPRDLWIAAEEGDLLQEFCELLM